MASNITVNQILDDTDTTSFRQTDYAKLFIWYLTDAQGNQDCIMSEIAQCFRDASLAVPNQTRLRQNLRRLKDVTLGTRYKSFRLHRNALTAYRSKYEHLMCPSPSPGETLRDRLDVSYAPSLLPGDIDDAYDMGQVYVIFHCLENSVRGLIRTVLTTELGEEWWSQAASGGMRRKLAERMSRESRNRWLPSRGSDELYYMDWADLVTLMRKYEQHFVKYISSVKFAELRLEELENLRNTIAHSGVLPDDEISRVELYFKDWCRQVSHHSA